MGVSTLHVMFDRAAPRHTHPARVVRDGSATVLPAADGGSAAAALIRRAFSVVTRLAAPVSAPSTRDHRLIVGARAVLLKGRAGSDVDQLAAAERSRDALAATVAAVHDLHSSQGQIAPHNGARGNP